MISPFAGPCARAVLGVALVGWACACGGGAAVPDGGLENIVVTHPDAAPIAPATACTVTVADAPAPSHDHVDTCSDITYTTNPPAGGDHYPVWADYRTYDAPVPWGFLVHSMEHGGVVLAYNCPDGCPDVVAAYQQIIDDHGPDSACPGGGTRFIIVPEPSLDVPIAAASWEHVYEATCLDVPSLEQFAEDHYAHGREDTCAAGLDGSSAGWCPMSGG